MLGKSTPILVFINMTSFSTRRIIHIYHTYTVGMVHPFEGDNKYLPVILFSLFKKISYFQ